MRRESIAAEGTPNSWGCSLETGRTWIMIVRPATDTNGLANVISDRVRELRGWDIQTDRLKGDIRRLNKFSLKWMLQFCFTSYSYSKYNRISNFLYFNIKSSKIVHHYSVEFIKFKIVVRTFFLMTRFTFCSFGASLREIHQTSELTQ